jgi:DNA-binding NarL/FixJ family response regulator
MSETFYIQENGEMREASPEEAAQILSDQQAYANAALEANTVRQSALAKLAALGLTEAEIAAL